MDYDKFLERYKGLFDDAYKFKEEINLGEHKCATIKKLKPQERTYVDEFGETHQWMTTLFNSLEYNIRQCTSDENELNSKAYGYSFPTHEDIEAYANNNDNSDKCTHYANESRAEIKAWITNLLDEKLEAKNAYRIVAGKVGSGKTTLVNYVVDGLKSWYKSDKIKTIVIKVQYDDWKSLAQKTRLNIDATDDERLTLIFDKCFAKTLASDKELISILKSAAFKDYYTSKRSEEIFDKLETEHLGEVEELENKASSFAKKEYKDLVKNITDKEESRINKIQEYVFLRIYKYFTSIGYKLLIVFDGMDQISIGGISEGKHSGLFAALSERVLNIQAHPEDRTIRYYFIITFRLCTCATFKSFAEAKHKEPMLRGLVPTNLNDILERATARYIKATKKTSTTRSAIREYFRLIIMSICKAFDCVTQAELAKHFNNNTRLLLEFIWQVTIYLAYTEIKSGNCTTPVKLFSRLAKAIPAEDDIDTSKAFRTRLWRIFILRDKKQFENFYDISGTKPQTFDTIQSINSYRSFVDNLFNYSDYFSAGDVHPLLFKIRLLQFLSYADYPLEPTISATMSLLGYGCSTNSALRLCCGAALAKVRTYSCVCDPITRKCACDYQFSITGTGRLALEKLIVFPRYTEYAIQRSIFPVPLLGAFNFEYESAPSRWLHLSLHNLFILYHYIRWIEEKESVCARKALSIVRPKPLEGVTQDFLELVASGNQSIRISHLLRKETIESCTRVAPFDAASNCKKFLSGFDARVFFSDADSSIAKLFVKG